MAATPSSYSITMRLYTAPDHGVIGTVATRIAEAGGIVTAIDMAESRHDRLVVDVTCSAANEEHSLQLVACVEEIEGVEVHFLGLSLGVAFWPPALQLPGVGRLGVPTHVVSDAR